MISYFIKIIIRNLLKLFFVFPVNKNYIFFDSFDGKELCCSPYYIFKYLYDKNKQMKFFISTSQKRKRNGNIIYVKYKSFSWILSQIRAGTIIVNGGFKAFIPFRKKQILINTWHGGGAYKKVGISFTSQKDLSAEIKTEDYVNKYLTYFISSSRIFTDVMHESKRIPMEKFLCTGLPRNDLFFNTELSGQINLQIREKYKIEKDAFVVLYAPTYRGTMARTYFENQLNIKQLKETLIQKFHKKIYFAYRGHYFINSQLNLNDIDFEWSNEPNMQELLCCSDLLITDYSSSMWDFSFTQKPCFLFTPDIDEYIKSRGFYSEPEKWGFPICKTNDELKEKIFNFDGTVYKEGLNTNHQFFGSYENGNATEQICKIVTKEIS